MRHGTDDMSWEPGTWSKGVPYFTASKCRRKQIEQLTLIFSLVHQFNRERIEDFQMQYPDIELAWFHCLHVVDINFVKLPDTTVPQWTPKDHTQ